MLSKMRQRVELQKPTRTSDNAGGVSIVWNTFATVFAYVQPKTGGKSIMGDQIEAEITHLIHIRFRPDLLASYRIKMGTKLFRINRIINVDERDRYFTIQAFEGVAT